MLDLALTPFAVTWAPTWLPGIGQKVKYGEQWKKQLHATAQTTVTIMQEGKVRPASPPARSLTADTLTGAGPGVGDVERVQRGGQG